MIENKLPWENVGTWENVGNSVDIRFWREFQDKKNKVVSCVLSPGKDYIYISYRDRDNLCVRNGRIYQPKILLKQLLRMQLKETDYLEREKFTHRFFTARPSEGSHTINFEVAQDYFLLRMTYNPGHQFMHTEINDNDYNEPFPFSRKTQVNRFLQYLMEYA